MLGRFRHVIAVSALAVAVSPFATSHATSAPRPAAGKPHVVAVALPLALGKALFWNGGYVVDADTHLPGAAACAVTACYDYPLLVAPGGVRLRVALDTPDRSNEFELDLVDPSGTVKDSATNPEESQFDEEVFAAHPAAGRWIVRVIPQSVHNAAFRLRSKLEKVALSYPKKTVLLPNLRVTPPYEFTFVAPANPANAVAPDSVNPPLSAAGQAPLSCTPDETVNDHVTRCLRFTTGPRDAGPGPFEIDYNPTGAGLGLQTPGPAFQRVYYSDGTSYLRPAGQFQFHPVHGHYHYLDFLRFQLYRVDISKTHRTLTPAGAGKKLGLCPADELFADWHTFNQQQTNSFTPNCGYAPGQASLGLNTGWGDVYRWQRPGQYVDFSGDGDGYYLLRVTVNAGGQALTVAHDINTGYAYVHIVGSRITVLERGQGKGPWDGEKTVFSDQ